ncbi:MAG: OmpA family protein [bacterium]
MKQTRTLLMAVIAVALVTTGCAKKQLLEEKDRQIADLRDNVQQLQEKNDELESQIMTQRNMNNELENTLADLRSKNDVLIDERDQLTHITLDGSANFATASANLTKEAKQVLDRIAAVLQNYPDRWVLIEGHADKRPIDEGLKWKYPSNWELSTARANAVLHYLLDHSTLDPSHVKAVGLGIYHPADEGSTPEALAKNRRVVIVVGSSVNVEKRMASKE